MQAVNMNFIGGRYLESNGFERDLMDIKLDMKFPSGKNGKKPHASMGCIYRQFMSLAKKKETFLL